MSKCNATLTTVTPTDDVVATRRVYCFHGEDVPDGTAVVRDGDRLLRLERHTLTCGKASSPGHEVHASNYEGGISGAMWWDDTKGATPHTPPADVCDECGTTRPGGTQ